VRFPLSKPSCAFLSHLPFLQAVGARNVIRIACAIAGRRESCSHTLVTCRDALNKDAKRLRVDLQDLRVFDADLGDQLERNPTEYLPLVRTGNSFLFARRRWGVWQPRRLRAGGLILLLMCSLGHASRTPSNVCRPAAPHNW